MINRYFLIFSLLFLSGVSFGQNPTAPFYFEQVKKDTLKEILANFEPVNLPFTFTEPLEEERLPIKIVNQFLGEEVVEDEIGESAWYYGYSFATKQFIGLIVTNYYSPGAFGIENRFLEVYTLTLEGEWIGKESLGCFCLDTNMGSNDYYATNLEITIHANRIEIASTETHATLIEEEDQPSFRKDTTSFYQIKLDTLGNMEKVER